MLTVGSLFSGIGGIELGLEATGGFRTIWQVEINPYCRCILEKHWPEVPKYGDITRLSSDDLERPDLLAGGFPCQDLSTAGLRAGLSGSRSGRLS
jgi:DNA (cytosine-5)-methyltransferase 1